MEELKRQRAALIQKLRQTNDLNKQYRLKIQIDFLERKMLTIKKKR
jgi:hypothetical protein